MPDGGQYIWNGGGEMDSGDEEKFFLLSLTTAAEWTPVRPVSRLSLSHIYSYVHLWRIRHV